MKHYNKVKTNGKGKQDYVPAKVKQNKFESKELHPCTFIQPYATRLCFNLEKIGAPTTLLLLIYYAKAFNSDFYEKYFMVKCVDRCMSTLIAKISNAIPRVELI